MRAAQYQPSGGKVNSDRSRGPKVARPHDNPLALYVAKLEHRVKLSNEARESLLALRYRMRSLDAYRDLVNVGSRPTHCCLVVTGMVSRYRVLGDGSRQILSFHFPGDMVDLQAALLMIADHGIRSHMPSHIAIIENHLILNLAARVPELGRAFWFDTLLDAAIFREWTVNVGRRSALQRTAHLLLELHYLLGVSGMSVGDSFPLPITQADLSEALAISAVHLNRTLSGLRAQGLIRTVSRTIIIEDKEKLIEIAGFDTTYLHPEGPRLP